MWMYTNEINKSISFFGRVVFLMWWIWCQIFKNRIKWFISTRQIENLKSITIFLWQPTYLRKTGFWIFMIWIWSWISTNCQEHHSQCLLDIQVEQHGNSKLSVFQQHQISNPLSHFCSQWHQFAVLDLQKKI